MGGDDDDGGVDLVGVADTDDELLVRRPTTYPPPPRSTLSREVRRCWRSWARLSPEPRREDEESPTRLELECCEALEGERTEDSPLEGVTEV